MLASWTRPFGVPGLVGLRKIRRFFRGWFSFSPVLHLGGRMSRGDLRGRGDVRPRGTSGAIRSVCIQLAFSSVISGGSPRVSQGVRVARRWSLRRCVSPREADERRTAGNMNSAMKKLGRKDPKGTGNPVSRRLAPEDGRVIRMFLTGTQEPNTGFSIRQS